MMVEMTMMVETALIVESAMMVEECSDDWDGNDGWDNFHRRDGYYGWAGYVVNEDYADDWAGIEMVMMKTDIVIYGWDGGPMIVEAICTYMTAIMVEMTYNPSKNVEEWQETGHFLSLSQKSSERKCGNITTRYIISHTCSVSIEYRTVRFYSSVRICSFQASIDLTILSQKYQDFNKLQVECNQRPSLK